MACFRKFLGLDMLIQVRLLDEVRIGGCHGLGAGWAYIGYGSLFNCSFVFILQYLYY